MYRYIFNFARAVAQVNYNTCKNNSCTYGVCYFHEKNDQAYGCLGQLAWSRLIWFSTGYSCYRIQLVLLETGISRQFWTLGGEKLCWRQELLLGMFCIPLPGSGQVASSKKEGTTSSTKEENIGRGGGGEQFIIRVLWRSHFYCKPELKLEPDALHLKAAYMLNASINDYNVWSIWLSSTF